jgi:hypothetical protein
MPNRTEILLILTRRHGTYAPPIERSAADQDVAGTIVSVVGEIVGTVCRGGGCLAVVGLEPARALTVDARTEARSDWT